MEEYEKIRPAREDVKKELTFTHLKRLATKELSAEFHPKITLTKVDQLFREADLKTFSDYKKETEKIFVTAGNILKKRCVLACESDGGEVILIPCLEDRYFENPVTFSCFTFYKNQIPKNVNSIAYGVLLDDEDYVLAKQRLNLDKQMNESFLLLF